MDQEHHKGGASPNPRRRRDPLFIMYSYPSIDPLSIYRSIYRSIIHHVSLSIILSRLRIHLEAPGRYCVDIGTILCQHCRHLRFCVDIADIFAILCRHCRHFGLLFVYGVFIVCCEICSVYSISCCGPVLDCSGLPGGVFVKIGLCDNWPKLFGRLALGCLF